ncbi:hypothetical protein MHI61_07745 [Rhizobium sp. K102]|nr:hypothetical protein [Rhizobium sp. K102]ULR45108.1 hypothetical protein MHI61_07745 [Rhizobium sp. K102]
MSRLPMWCLPEFFPHVNDDPDYLPSLLRYSERTANLIPACRDGEGLILGNGLVEVFGAPLMISGGFVEAADRGRIVELLSCA